LGRTANADWTEVVDLPYDGPSPDLPRLRGRKWNELVVTWWEAVRTMPHCRLWREPDWQFALETALMKQRYWIDYADGEPQTTMAVEIRRREDQMGCTAEARRKLRVRYVDPPDDAFEAPDPNDGPVVVVEQETADPGVGNVTPLASRRRRLTA